VNQRNDPKEKRSTSRQKTHKWRRRFALHAMLGKRSSCARKALKVSNTPLSSSGKRRPKKCQQERSLKWGEGDELLYPTQEANIKVTTNGETKGGLKDKSISKTWQGTGEGGGDGGGTIPYSYRNTGNPASGTLENYLLRQKL